MTIDDLIETLRLHGASLVANIEPKDCREWADLLERHVRQGATEQAEDRTKPPPGYEMRDMPPPGYEVRDMRPPHGAWGWETSRHLTTGSSSESAAIAAAWADYDARKAGEK